MTDLEKKVRFISSRREIYQEIQYYDIAQHLYKYYTGKDRKFGCYDRKFGYCNMMLSIYKSESKLILEGTETNEEIPIDLKTAPVELENVIDEIYKLELHKAYVDYLREQQNKFIEELNKKILS